jgi:hypothetical protein
VQHVKRFIHKTSNLAHFHMLSLSAGVDASLNTRRADMEPDTLQGFTGAAQALGFAVTDPRAFLKEQQKRVFEWAQPQS